MQTVVPAARLGLITIAAITLAACGGQNSSPPDQPTGRARSATTGALEAGANALQDITPVKQIGIYMVGFHPMKDNPAMQMEAHHYCNQVNEDFAQCVLFDGNTTQANMTGLEYIISETLFNTLPQDERKYWHPHNYEILSGQLVAPGLPAVAEKELMRKKMNSYGKTWHVWMSQNDKLPLGDPQLAWSFNHDGELHPRFLEQRNTRMKLDTATTRESRHDLVPDARPQSGVEDLAGRFGPTPKPVPGVVDLKQAPSPR